jgi:hypothetical protein
MLEKQDWVFWVVNGCLEGKFGSLKIWQEALTPLFRSVLPDALGG